MTQLMPLPLTVSWFSKIQIGFTFPVPAHPGTPGERAVKRLCVCVCASVCCLTLQVKMSTSRQTLNCTTLSGVFFVESCFVAAGYIFSLSVFNEM